MSSVTQAIAAYSLSEFQSMNLCATTSDVWNGAPVRSLRQRPPLTRMAANAAKRAVAATGCGLNLLLGSRAQQRFGILMYHRFAENVSGVTHPTWNVTPAAFQAQLQGLLSRNFQPWSLTRLLEHCRRGFAVPPRTFAVTIDDGYESVYRNAWPVLKQVGVPATVFLSTAYIDSDGAFPCDDWSAAGSDRVPSESWRPMTTQQCQEMAAGGLVELGAHTHTHQDFRARPDEFARDLTINVELLQLQFGIANPPFAFPYGRATSRMMDVVRQSGLSCGLTTAESLVDPRDKPFGWARFNVEDWDTPATLAAKLSGWCSWPRKIRRRIIAWRRPELISG